MILNRLFLLTGLGAVLRAGAANAVELQVELQVCSVHPQGCDRGGTLVCRGRMPGSAFMLQEHSGMGGKRDLSV